ncbi:MAG: PrgI family protein [bacterium]|nr:PrgI family protein [bacterium]
MAQYKVPQNVESEDKILGPLSLRQFIYVIIGIMWAALMWAIFRQVIVLAVVFALPVTGLFLLLGFGKKEEQSFENYFIALIRFRFVPRGRIWMKDEKVETSIVQGVPKVEEVRPTRSAKEVKGQLSRLALVLDTHGYVNKSQSNLQLADESNLASALSSRVANPELISQEILGARVVVPEADVMDLEKNQRAVTVAQLLQQAGDNVRSAALEEMQQALVSPQPASPEASQVRTTGQPQTQPSAPVSQPLGQNAILKTVTVNPNLTVAQIANRADQAQPSNQTNQAV